MSEPVLEIPFDDAFRFDPSPTFTELRENRPVARVRTLAGAEVWLVTRYDDVRLVFAHRRIERTRPWVAELSARLAEDVAAAGDGADIRQLVALPLPIQVICQLL